MLTEPLGLGPTVSQLFAYESERWDGKGLPDGVREEQIPLPVRIVHVARDAAFQQMLGDEEFVAQVIAERAGGAFDPSIAERFVKEAAAILEVDSTASPWELVLASEPKPWRMLEGEAIDQALAAMGHFSDIAVPHMVGHSGGVARMGSAAATLLGFDPAEGGDHPPCRARP